jgi:hypothetical protein
MLYQHSPLPPLRTCAAKGHMLRMQCPLILYSSPSSTISLSLLALFCISKRKGSTRRCAALHDYTQFQTNSVQSPHNK